ncbi:SRPBCC family protein [Nocardia stercoris]|uniref:SRPBCC family protein n=1 Tax=Nocardia stercoris TaxID=2483361 RepID=A0A3M2KTB1_9NOCA|nr:hypothetical protein [Nocardia stercoris]RMI27916.1 hypothetical protein EBN03_32270 [Nocardia stercoris]
MKYLVGCALAASIALAGSPAAQAAQTCTSTPNLYTPGWQVGWAAYQVAQITPPIGDATRVDDLPITINAPIAHVWSAYSNLNNALGRHPFLQALYPHCRCTDGVTTTLDFTAIENITFVPGVTDPAQTEGEQILHPDQYYYTSDTYDLPGVITHQKITFVDNGDGTTSVNEHLTFIASIALIDFTETNGVSSHKTLQAALKRDIENGTI